MLLTSGSLLLLGIVDLFRAINAFTVSLTLTAGTAHPFKSELFRVAGNFSQAHAVHVEIEAGGYCFPSLFGSPETIVNRKGVLAFLAEITPFLCGVVEPETPFDYVRAFAFWTLFGLEIALVLVCDFWVLVYHVLPHRIIRIIRTTISI